jgi:hypothetical protein
VIVQIFIPSLKLPQPIYLIIALVGLIWAGFISYVEILKKNLSDEKPIIPGLSIAKSIIPGLSIAKSIIPELSIMFEEGNEYSYSLDQTEISLLRDLRKATTKKGEKYIDPENEFTLPKSLVTLFVRLENTGLIPINLLTIFAEIDLAKPYQFMVPDVFLSDGTQISYPKLLKPKDILQVKIIGKIFPFSLFSDAQIAARNRELLDKKIFVEAEVYIEFTNPEGNMQREKESHRLSLTPLCKLYTSHWTKIGRTDLVNLAKN